MSKIVITVFAFGFLVAAMPGVLQAAAPAPGARAPAVAPVAPADPELELPPETELDTEASQPVEGRIQKTKKEKKSNFDNSRTDINLYNKTVSDKDRVKSIFYSPTEIKDVHLAVNTYLKNIGRGGELTFDEEAFLSRLGGLKKSASSTNNQNRFFTYPQFFLDSLVYYSANDWLVWINGEKITQNTPRESSNIRVIGITPDKVTVEWFPLEMDRVTEIWKKFPSTEVTVNAKHSQVIFTLKPNQTFSSYLMKALEGRVLPVTVDITQTAMSVMPEEEPKPGDEGEPVTDETKKEGLSGLINSYQQLNQEGKNP